jgi:hypothetical protein
VNPISDTPSSGIINLNAFQVFTMLEGSDNDSTKHLNNDFSEKVAIYLVAG